MAKGQSKGRGWRAERGDRVGRGWVAGLCCALLPAWAVAQATLPSAAPPPVVAAPDVETPAQVHERVRQVCGPFEAGVPAELDLDASEEEVTQRQLARLPGHLDLACHRWWSALARFGPFHTTTLRAQVTLSIGLVWEGRPSESQQIAIGTREQLLPRRDFSRSDLASLTSIIAYGYALREELANALTEYEAALHWNALPDPLVEKRREVRWTMLQSYASVLIRMRQLDRAEPVLVDLMRDLENADPPAEPRQVGWVLNALANLESRRERFEAAEAYFRREIALWSGLPAREGWGGATVGRSSLGLLLMKQGRFDEAEAAFREGLSAAAAPPREADFLSAAAHLHDAWSAFLLQRGRAAEAETAAREALAVVRTRQEAGSAREMRPRLRLGQALAAAGDLGGAIEQFRLNQRWVDAGEGDVTFRYGTWFQHARVLVELGDYAEARRIVARAQEEVAKVPAMHAERAELLRLSALLKQASADPAGVLEDLAQAEQVLAPVYAEGSAERVELKVLACPVDAAACAALGQALGWAGRDAAHPALPPELEARAALALGAQARSQDDAAEAARRSRAALNAAVRAGSRSLLGLAYGLQADVADDAGRADEAILFGKLALAETQRQRARVVALGSAAESLFVERRTEVYRSLADRLAGQGRIAEALAVMRLTKRAEQADWGQRGLRTEPGVQPGGDAALPLSPTEQRLQQLLFDVLASHQAVADEYARLRRLQATQSLSAEERERLAALAGDSRRQRDQLQAELEQALDRLSAEATALATPATSARRRELRELARLRPRESRTVHAYLLPSPRGLRAVVVGRERTWVRSRSLAPGVLSRDVAAWLAAVAETRAGRSGPGAASPPGGLDALNARLYDQVGRLIDEPARQAGARRIVLWLDGVLRHLPIAALHDGRQHLAQKYVLVHAAPSWGEGPAAAGAATRRPAGWAGMPAPWRLQAFGMTESAAGLPALPGVARELCSIVRGPVAGLGPDRTIVAQSGCTDGGTRGTGAVAGSASANRHFTAERLRQTGQKEGGVSTLLHIGTHFVLRPGHVERSWLLLGDGQRFGLADVARLDLRGQQLVTLSACESGTPAGDATDGRQIDGLASAVLGAGARQVLASLWRVDDQATAQFMRLFYEESNRASAQDGAPPDLAAALQRTQARLLAGAASGGGIRTADWAAFVLMEAR